MTTASILLTRVDSARPGGCRRVGIRPSRLPPPSRPSSRAPNCEEGIVGRGRGECQHRTGESVSNLKPNGRGGVEEGLGGGDGGLEVLREAAVATDPREEALYHPSAGMDGEADCPLGLRTISMRIGLAPATRVPA